MDPSNLPFGPLRYFIEECQIFLSRVSPVCQVTHVSQNYTLFDCEAEFQVRIRFNRDDDQPQPDVEVQT